MRVVSRWCRCVVQRLCATDCKHPCLVRAVAPHSARHERRACMLKRSMQGRIQVVEQSRCRTHRQQTTTIAQMQSQQSIHSPSPWGRGFRQGCRNKDTPSFKHGCLQVVEQSRCRTHRQQTTTVAQRQSHQSVLKGIGIINQKLISKTDFFYKLRAGSVTCHQFFAVFYTR